MHTLIPADADGTDLHRLYADGWLDEGGVRANFIASADGSATAAGLSRGLQTAGDNAVFAVLRDLADVVLVGASTARAEGYAPIVLSERRRRIRGELGLSPLPATAVLSGSLDLDLSVPLFAAATDESPTIVITGPTAPMGPRNDIIDLAGSTSTLRLLEVGADEHGGVDIAGAVAELRDLGYRRILCEGGPRIMSALFAAGICDELCLTVSPKLVGPGGPRIVTGPSWPDGFAVGLRIAGLLEEDGALFLRYRVDPRE